MYVDSNGDILTRYLRNHKGCIVAELHPTENIAINFTFVCAGGEGLEISSGGQSQVIIGNGVPVTSSKVFTPGDVENGISFKPAWTGPVSLSGFTISTAPLVNCINIPGAGNEIVGQRRFTGGIFKDYFYI